jgi:hypothetical protein
MKARVVTRKQVSKEFDITTEVKQGCCIAPILLDDIALGNVNKFQYLGGLYIL